MIMSTCTHFKVLDSNGIQKHPSYEKKQNNVAAKINDFTVI